MATRKKTITERQFQVLVTKIRKIRDDAEDSTVDSALATYWTYGDLIAGLRLASEVGYHNSVLRDLSRETGISLRVLQHSVAFRDTYRTAPVGQGLSWSHYRVLVRVPTERQRKFYAELARKNEWTTRELQQAIRSDLFDGGKLEAPRLARPASGAFLYKAKELRVIDGDTIEALVDLGFQSFTQQRLRLAQIDAPDIETKGGRAARNFLVDTLASARTTVLQTIKTDFHGRYVAHVFSAPADMSVDECFQTGVHVNDLLVRQRHAHVVG